MTIFIKEYIIYWGELPNLFFVDYTPTNFLIIEKIIFDNTSYDIMYKTSFFSMVKAYPTVNKYHKFVMTNLFWAKGKGWLRCYRYEYYYVFKKFCYVKKSLNFYDLIGYKFYFNGHTFPFEYSNSPGFLNMMQESSLAKTGWYARVRPRRWWPYVGKETFYIFKYYTLSLKKEEYCLQFLSWTKLYIYLMAGMSRRLFCVNAQNILYYNLTNLDLFTNTWGSYFVPNYLVLDVNIKVYLRLTILNTLFGLCILLFYLFNLLKIIFSVNLIYDLIFILFFFNKTGIRCVMYVYYWLIGFYEEIRFNIASLRLWKPTLMLETESEFKRYFDMKEKARRNYLFAFKLKGISKKEEKINRVTDDKVASHFFLLYLLKYKYNSFLKIEKFVIQLTYFFHPNYFNDLLKITTLRSVFYYINFMFIIVFIYFPIYFINKLILFLIYRTYFVIYFIKSYVYGVFHGYRFEDLFEDSVISFERFKQQHYEFWIYWIGFIQDYLFYRLYIYSPKKKMIKRYLRELAEPLNKDRPKDVIWDEYQDDKSWYSLLESHFAKMNELGILNKFRVEKLAGIFTRNYYHSNDFFLDDPFYLNCYIFYIKREVIKSDTVVKTVLLYRFLIKYLPIFYKIIKNIKFSVFFYSYLFYWVFYPVYLLNYFLKLYYWLVNAYMSGFKMMVFFSLSFFLLILKKFLMSYWVVRKIVAISIYIYVNIILEFIKLLIFLKNTVIVIRVSEKTYNSFLLFYFWISQYNLLKIIGRFLSIFFFRLWIWVLCFIFIIFFFDNIMDIKLVFVDSFFKDFMFEMNYYQVLFFDENFVTIKGALAKWKFHVMRFVWFFIQEDLFFDWSIIHTDWVDYLKAWYKLWRADFDLYFPWSPIKDICLLLNIDYKWYCFQIKLFLSLDWGFIEYNWIFGQIKYSSLYHFIIKYYYMLIISNIYFFFDWWYHYFIYCLVFFIDTRLNFLNFNEILIYLINIPYNMLMYLDYSFYTYMIGEFREKLRLFEIESLRLFFSEVKLSVKVFIAYDVIRAYAAVDFFLFIEYYWYYFYHYLYFYSYKIFYNVYSNIVYILNIFLPMNWQFSYWTYNVVGAFEILNLYFTYPILIFFHKFFMFFFNESYDFHLRQNEFPVIQVPYLFPFNILKETQFTGSTTVNQFFFRTWIFKISIIENVILNGWKYNTRFATTLFLLSTIYVSVIIFFLTRFFIFSFKSFRWTNLKLRFTQSNIRLWDNMHSRNRHLFTDYEYNWMYSFDWVQSFEKYWVDVFHDDPFVETMVVLDEKTGDEKVIKVSNKETFMFIYKYLTQVYRSKQNRNSVGWRIICNLDDYYFKRYQDVMELADTIYSKGLGLKKQTYAFNKIGIFFDTVHFWTERNRFYRKYFSHEKRFEEYSQFKGNYDKWLFKIVIPLLYEYCDDPKFIKNYMSFEPDFRRNLWKLETMLDDKFKYKVDFVELYFTEPKFYHQFYESFEPDDETVFGKFMQHRYTHSFTFNVWYGEKHSLNKPWIYKNIFPIEDFFYKMSKWDEKYCGNLLNITTYNIFDWPQLLRTRIQLNQLISLYDAHNPDTTFEETKFMPSTSGLYRGDTERDHEFQARVNAFWRKVLVETDDEYYNELGLFVERVEPIFPFIYGVYGPLILVGGQFIETFAFHSNFQDVIVLMFGYVFSAFQFIDMEFSTWAMNDTSFIVNPTMGAMVTRDWGISPVLSYVGQGFQPWILYNVDIPDYYQRILFYYSYPNIEFYPYQDYFSYWEKVYYFYYEDIIFDNFSKNHIRYRTDLKLDLPIGLDLYQLEYEFRDSWYKAWFIEISSMFMLWFVGKIPSLLPLLIVFVIFYIEFIILLYCINGLFFRNIGENFLSSIWKANRYGEWFV